MISSKQERKLIGSQSNHLSVHTISGHFENFDVFGAYLSYFQMGRGSALTKNNQSISETTASKLN